MTNNYWGSSKLSFYTIINDLLVLSLLTTLLSIVNVHGLLICGNSLNWFVDLKLNLTFKSLWIGVASEFLIAILGKLNLFHLLV